MGLFSGLLSIGRGLIGSASGPVGVATRAVVRVAPGLGAAAAGGAAFSAGATALTGGGAAPVAAQVGPAPGPAGQFVVLGDGSRALLSSSGIPLRPQFFLTAGAQIPGGATIVSISANGLLFGIRRARRRRSTFRTELNKCKNVVVSASKLLKVLRK